MRIKACRSGELVDSPTTEIFRMSVCAVWLGFSVWGLALIPVRESGLVGCGFETRKVLLRTRGMDEF